MGKSIGTLWIHGQYGSLYDNGRGLMIVVKSVKKIGSFFEKIIPTKFLPVIILISFFFMLGTMTFECNEYKYICYKIECNFWGCHELEVDMDSSSCEKTDRVCISEGDVDLEFSVFWVVFIVLIILGSLFKVIVGGLDENEDMVNKRTKL